MYVELRLKKVIYIHFLNNISNQSQRQSQQIKQIKVTISIIIQPATKIQQPYKPNLNMLSSILNNPQSIANESSLISLNLNPQKPTQKTSQSSQHEKQLSTEEYTKLQALLQSRQASLRQHAKHQYQLKMFIEDLQQKNKALQKNNTNILIQYKAEVTSFKRQNQHLRKMLQKLQAQNVILKKQLQEVFTSPKNQKLESINRTPEPTHNRVKSQSVIKVIESVDYKQSFRESQPNFRRFPFNLSQKQSPIMPIEDSSKNFQSRQKLQVTIKSSRFMQQVQGQTSGRNQKHILGQNLKHGDSILRNRSIKKLTQVKQMKEGAKDLLVRKKIQLQRGNSSISKRAFQQQSSVNEQSNRYKEQSSHIMQGTGQDRMMAKNLSRQLEGNMQISIQSGGSRQLVSGQERRSRQVKRTKPNDYELIKLGHYGSNTMNADKVKAHLEMGPQNQHGKSSKINQE